jgi:hypothetical protein
MESLGLDHTHQEKKEELRRTLLQSCHELQRDWQVMDTWITRDAYQDRSHEQFAKNKKRTAWFTSVFHLAEQVSRYPFLGADDRTRLIASKNELHTVFKRMQQERMSAYVEQVIPLLKDFFRQYVDADISEDILSIIAVQLAKDPSGHVASQTLLMAAEQDTRIQEVCQKFPQVEVQIQKKINFQQTQSPELAAVLANFAIQSNIVDIREQMGNPQGLVDVGDALLVLTESLLIPQSQKM